MASSVNFAQNTYSGEVLNDLLTYTAQGNDTYKEGLIHIKSGIQFKYTIPTIQLGKVIQDNVHSKLNSWRRSRNYWWIEPIHINRTLPGTARIHGVP